MGASSVLHCLNDHPTGRVDALLAARFGKADGHGSKLASVPFAVAWTGRVLRRMEEKRPECIASYCPGCKRWTEYAVVLPLPVAA